MNSITPYLCCSILCLLSFAFSAGSVAKASTNTADLTEEMVEAVIQPNITDFKIAAEALQLQLERDCSTDTSQAAYRNIVVAFSMVEFIRLGIMNQDNRFERLFFWPDRQGIGQRQLRKLSVDFYQNPSTLIQLQRKSVAAQGLPALERLLFSGTTDDIRKNCSLMTLIGLNLVQIAEELDRDWNTSKGVATSLLNPSSDSVYRTEAESLAALFTLADASLQVVADIKLRTIMVGIERKRMLPANAPFYRSGQTFENIQLNLNSVYRLFEKSGVSSASSDFAQFQFEHRTAQQMLKAAKSALEDSANSQVAMDRLKALQSIVRNMRRIIQESIAPDVGVTTGFNSSDGD